MSLTDVYFLVVVVVIIVAVRSLNLVNVFQTRSLLTLSTFTNTFVLTTFLLHRAEREFFKVQSIRLAWRVRKIVVKLAIIINYWFK